MAFALSVLKLEDALKKPGCAICRIGFEASVQSINAYLWEKTLDPGTWATIKAAYGFCPEHTRMLVASELSNDGPALGVNMIYEQLGRVLGRDLKALQQREKVNRAGAPLAKMLGMGGRSRQDTLLTPKGRCPACENEEEVERNNLSALFEELEKQKESLVASYHASDGLCLEHLRLGLELNGEEYGHAADWLINDTVQRLTGQSDKMLEYIRKHNWEYRDEQTSQEENTAWVKTLTFFTGFPESRFNHKIDHFSE
jgi:hypothetical protein